MEKDDMEKDAVKRPFIIFLDGPDGVGKTTVAKTLTELFLVNGYKAKNVCVMRYTKAGQINREVAITEGLSDSLLFLNFCFSTFYGIDSIYKNETEQQIVIVDRSQASTFAQNIVAPHISESMKTSMLNIFNNLQQEFLKKYKGYFFNYLLTLDPKIAFERFNARNPNLDFFEKKGIEFQRRILEGFETHFYINNNPIQMRIDTEKNNPENVALTIYKDFFQSCHLMKNT